MKTLAFSDLLLGPFNDTEIEIGTDRVTCGGVAFPFEVIGAYEILDEAPPEPLADYRWDGTAFALKTLDPMVLVEAVAVARADQLAAAGREYETRRQTAVAWNFGGIATQDDAGQGAGPAGPQALQMRDDGVNDDLKNWLSVAAVASAHLAAGQPEALTPLKTADNLWVQTTAAEVVAVLTVGVDGRPGLLARQSLILARYGALKKQIADAADLAALDAIDLAAGWPG